MQNRGRKRPHPRLERTKSMSPNKEPNQLTFVFWCAAQRSVRTLCPLRLARSTSIHRDVSRSENLSSESRLQHAFPDANLMRSNDPRTFMVANHTLAAGSGEPSEKSKGSVSEETGPLRIGDSKPTSEEPHTAR